jgi:putative sigma-54 modulation protein
MELQIAGTNMEIAPEVRRYVERKLGKLNRHLRHIIDIRVEISEEKTRSPRQRYLVRATVNGEAGGAVFHGEERGEDLFRAVDKVVTIMTRQIEHHKGKLHRKARGSPLARGKFSEVEGREPGKIVKTKRFALEPMSVAEARDNMETLGHSFFLFFDADEARVKLLYRRNDGDYGLIEPEINRGIDSRDGIR